MYYNNIALIKNHLLNLQLRPILMTIGFLISQGMVDNNLGPDNLADPKVFKS